LLAYGAFNMLNRWFQTGNRRYEFERLYAEHGDVWSFSTSEYERAKYSKTLALALKLCPEPNLVLEVGCGTGVFSGLLAQCFRTVLAIDISGEALNIAATANREATNIEFQRRDFRRLTGNTRFDLIVCAEVLYYLREADSEVACQALDRLLAKRGVILTVSGIPKADAAKSASGYFNGWNDIFGRYFEGVASMDVMDAGRPYRIAGFARRNDRTA
jgi:2-polyprenyl-3-methyl-5-hydroxy-6-metoxy-1,4-benzoquinol methylase